jgi:ribonuclease III
LIKQLWQFKNFFNTKEDKIFAEKIKNLIGQNPYNVQLYKLALTNRNKNHQHLNTNERLEFLGDALLSAIVAEFLFVKFPQKDEGFLTKLRSRIVNRANLNMLSLKFGLDKIINSNETNNFLGSSLPGNTLEAFIGAVYLDKGYDFTKTFVLQRLIENHLDINSLEQNDKDFKSQVVEYTQKIKVSHHYELIETSGKTPNSIFHIALFIDGKNCAVGKFKTKKGAEQMAAENYLKSIEAI